MFAHLTLPTQHVEETTRFLEKALGLARKPVPANSPVDARWLDIGHGQELHVFFVKEFVVSRYEAEFGRHVALFHPLEDLAALRQRVVDAGGVLVEPLRATPFERVFFREPVNGYLFEVIDSARHREILAEQARAKVSLTSVHSNLEICHPERSEGSACTQPIADPLPVAQDDNTPSQDGH